MERWKRKITKKKRQHDKGQEDIGRRPYKRRNTRALPNFELPLITQGKLK